jgi:phage terminase large subunit
MVMRDSLVSRDPVLVEAKKPCGFAEEVDGYCWRVDLSSRRLEEPVKEDDHGCDCARYMVAAVDLRPKKKFVIFA